MRPVNILYQILVTFEITLKSIHFCPFRGYCVGVGPLPKSMFVRPMSVCVCLCVCDDVTLRSASNDHRSASNDHLMIIWLVTVLLGRIIIEGSDCSTSARITSLLHYRDAVPLSPAFEYLSRHTPKTCNVLQIMDRASRTSAFDNDGDGPTQQSLKGPPCPAGVI